MRWQRASFRSRNDRRSARVRPTPCLRHRPPGRITRPTRPPPTTVPKDPGPCRDRAQGARDARLPGMQVHLVDGTYELFRYHYSPNNKDTKRGATRGVVSSCLALLEGGATHVAVATDQIGRASCRERG